MKPLLATLLLVLLPAWSQAQTVTLPETATAEVGDFAVVHATSDGPTVKWFFPDSGLKVFPPEILRDPKTLVVWARTAGKYRIVAWTAKGDAPSDPAVCTVVVGTPPPGPNPPGPTPPPTPADPFTQAVQTAYASETAANKAQLKASLAGVYQAGVTLAQDSTLATAGDLLNALSAKAQAAGVAGATVLPAVKKVIQAELQAHLPSSASSALDATTRQTAASEFGKVAQALGAVQTQKGK
jgi:hypothetical protein